MIMTPLAVSEKQYVPGTFIAKKERRSMGSEKNETKGKAHKL
jgi:hypothetical protein